MCKKLTSWLLWAGLLSLLASGLQAQIQQIKMTRLGPTVEVRDLEGVELKFQANEGDVFTEDELIVSEQDMVLTVGDGSRVILVFSNGATINIGEKSKVEIRQFTQNPFEEEFAFADETSEPSSSQTVIHLTEGELIGQVKSLHEDSSFTVSTPAGAAGIRGTTFRVVFRPQGDGTAFFTITTVEGDVAVTTNDGTVSTPISVTDQQEIEIIVEVDDATGVVTVISAPEALVVTPASTAVVAVVTEAVQAAAEAVIEIVLAPVTTTGGTTGGGTSGDEGDAADQQNEQPDGDDPEGGGNQEGGEQNQTPANQTTTDSPSTTAGG